MAETAREMQEVPFSRVIYDTGDCCSRCLQFNEGFEHDRLQPPYLCPIFHGALRCPARPAEPLTVEDIAEAIAKRFVPQHSPQRRERLQGIIERALLAYAAETERRLNEANALLARWRALPPEPNPPEGLVSDEDDIAAQREYWKMVGQLMEDTDRHAAESNKEKRDG